MIPDKIIQQVDKTVGAHAPNYQPDTVNLHNRPYDTGATKSVPRYQSIDPTKNVTTAPLTQPAGSDWSSQKQIDHLAQGLQEAIQAINVLSSQFRSFAGL